MSAVSTTLVLLALACLLIMALLLSAADRSVRDVRSSIFPIVREEGATRARRARLGATVAAVLAAVAAVGFFVSGEPILPGVFPSVPVGPLLAQLTSAGVSVSEPTHPPTTQPAPSLTHSVDTVTPTVLPDEPSPTVAPSPTPTETPVLPTATSHLRSPTSSPTPSPTQTATTALAAAVSTPDATSTPPPSATAVPSPTAEGTPAPVPQDVQMGPIAFSEEIDARRMPVSPGSVFSETVRRVYAVFPFSGMQKGISWTQVWFINGEEFARERADWQWGEQDHSYIFVKPVGAGEYRLDLYVSNQLLASGEFEVLGPTGIGGPINP